MKQTTSKILLLLTFVATSVFSNLVIQAASPRLSIITPRSIQRGVETDVVFSGSILKDAQEVFFYSPGLSVTKLEAINANSFKAKVKVAADCRLGEHTAQVRTATGISDYRTIFVSALPLVNEKEPNSDFKTPQKINLNVTVHGIVQNEDVDYFSVDMKKGQRLSVEIEGMRLGNTMFDPFVAILDSKRFELASADDTPLLKQDAATSVIVPADGTYIIEVRESAYAGNGNCRYCVHIGTFPRPTSVYPAGGQIGTKLEVKFLGDSAGEMKQSVDLPKTRIEEFGLFAQTKDGISPSHNPFRLFEHGNILEVEPNNNLATATPSELPKAFNGIISEPNDADYFKFKAKKGVVYEIECYARRIRSPLDSVMYLYNSKGKQLLSNDDSRRPDSYFRFTVPADDEYTIMVKDHLNRGGANFVYRIEASPIKASLKVQIPRVARYQQYRQQIFVPKGGRYATVMNIGRSNFGGEVILDPKSLPKGITMHTEPVKADMSSVAVVFEASADAPVGGALIDFQARHVNEKTGIFGHFYNRGDFVIAQPGQSLYSWKDVNRIPVAVVNELPFSIEIVQPKVPLVQNGSMQLKVIAHRNKGFDAPINVQFPFRPPGVGAPSSVNIPKGKNEVLIPLNANGKARVRKWKVFALGSANVGGSGWCSSQLATLEIAAPYIQITMDRAAAELGQETELLCKLEKQKDFPGNAKVQLIGLPHKVTAPQLEFNKDSKELVFKIKIDKASPAGKHGNIRCQIVIIENNEPVLQYQGSTQLRIDKPLPPKPNTKPKPKPKPKAVAKVNAPKKPAPRRLTRLEKLRLEVKERVDEN